MATRPASSREIWVGVSSAGLVWTDPPGVTVVSSGRLTCACSSGLSGVSSAGLTCACSSGLSGVSSAGLTCACSSGLSGGLVVILVGPVFNHAESKHGQN